MDEKRLEYLRGIFNLTSESDIQQLRRDVEATIALLQRILNKPENVQIDLDLSDGAETGNRSRAWWNEVEIRPSESGFGHEHIAGSYHDTELSYEYAQALKEFLERIGMSYHGIELPARGEKEDIIKAVRERLEWVKKSRLSTEEAIEKNEALLKELEASG